MGGGVVKEEKSLTWFWSCCFVWHQARKSRGGEEHVIILWKKKEGEKKKMRNCHCFDVEAQEAWEKGEEEEGEEERISHHKKYKYMGKNQCFGSGERL